MEYLSEWKLVVGVGVGAIVAAAWLFSQLESSNPVAHKDRILTKIKDSAPSKARDGSGAYAFGIYKQPISDPNVAAAPLAAGLLSSWRLKHWHHQVTFSPDNAFLIATAVVQLGYVSNAWAYVVDFAAGKMHEYRDLAPLGVGASVAESSVRGTSRWSRGGNTLRFEATPDGDLKTSVDVRVDGAQRLKAEYTAKRMPDSLALLCQLDGTGRRAAYTHKAAFRISGGEFEFGGKARPLAGGFAMLDWTRSYAARVTTWKWACFAGRARDGRPVGLNLSAEVYGDEENVVWVDGKVYQIGHVTFAMKDKPWKVTSGRVDLTFVPATVKRENVQALVITSTFVQVCGRFSGSIIFDENQLPVTVEGVTGIMEDHYAKW